MPSFTNRICYIVGGLEPGVEVDDDDDCPALAAGVEQFRTVERLCAPLTKCTSCLYNKTESKRGISSKCKHEEKE